MTPGTMIGATKSGGTPRFALDRMRTGISAKFDIRSASRMLEEADPMQIAFHADDQRLFGLALGAAR